MLKKHGMDYNEEGHLLFAKMDTVKLAEKYGTPLYLYDVEKIRKNARSFKNSFDQLGVRGKVAYASKAFSCIAITEIMDEEGLYLDVVSKGELHTALAANFPAERIHFHGNNKSYAELKMAIENQIGCIVIDNFHEIQLIESILDKTEQTVKVLLRVSPGIDVDTHKYIRTGNEDSKFGFNMRDQQIDKAFQYLLEKTNIRVKGIHFHIGSQLFDVDQYIASLNVVLEKIADWHRDFQYIPSVLNVGGGFAIKYTANEERREANYYLEPITKLIKEKLGMIGLPLPEIWIEPGRSIVGDAGITLYEIGSIKDIPKVRKYVSVDGGMTDNIRPALYKANYQGVIANKANQKPTEKVTIAGKCCESGDILIDQISLAKVEAKDIFALFSTGAYGYSMASNYNRLPRPATVFIEDEKDDLVIRRETYQDLLKNDLSYRK